MEVCSSFREANVRLVITMLLIAENGTSREIPWALGNCSQLRFIDFSYNNLSGRIPLELALLPDSKYLNLASNNLENGIPASLGNCSNLVQVDIRINGLEGYLPMTIFRLPLFSVYLANNMLTGTLSEATGNLTHLNYIDLSGNRFTRNWPEVIGNLSSLTFSNLSALFSNGSTVKIPDSINRLSEMTFLSYSETLWGRIPESITKLSKLITLRLSFNRRKGHTWIHYQLD